MSPKRAKRPVTIEIIITVTIIFGTAAINLIFTTTTATVVVIVLILILIQIMQIMIRKVILITFMATQLHVSHFNFLNLQY